MAGLTARVTAAAESALAQGKVVSPIDVLVGVGWLHTVQVERWRQGRVATLEEQVPVDAAKMAAAVEALRKWAMGRGLTPSETAYVSGSRDRAPLRFTAAGDDAAYRVHWMSPELSPARRQQIAERQNKAPDLVAVVPSAPFDCAECAGTGPYLIMSNAGPLCLTCADLDHLIFLPAGNAALSRRAKRESALAAVVVEHNRRRKRYERRGVLVEEAALIAAEEQCLADEDIRERRRGRDRERRAEQDVAFTAAMAAAIRGLFPGCPPERANAIADHAAVRGSGRVGRSAAAKVLDANAVTLAVIASVRHLDTDYDRMLMSGVARADARDRIRPDVDRVLSGWRDQCG
ncbi:MAG: DUF2293 domain-containing protein [Mycobacteriaceae bacterium]|nr:DUF2293 domain-containing protein [Mycobacteriaceae bacterium]